MARWNAGAAAAALLATSLALPLAAQQPAAPEAGPRGPGPGPSTSATSVPDALVTKTGAALRQVSAIRQSYAPRIAAAHDDREKQSLQQQAMDEAVKAVNDQGLSLDQYNHVIQLAQADPDLEQRLITAAKSAK